MITIEDAFRIAIEAHEGQKDLDGNPVILHPMTVAIARRNLEEQIIGLLHDVVEDSDITFEELIRRGVDKNVVDALRLLAHDKDKMTYEEYVGRSHPLATTLPYMSNITTFAITFNGAGLEAIGT